MVKKNFKVASSPTALKMTMCLHQQSACVHKSTCWGNYSSAWLLCSQFPYTLIGGGGGECHILKCSVATLGLVLGDPSLELLGTLWCLGMNPCLLHVKQVLSPLELLLVTMLHELRPS